MSEKNGTPVGVVAEVKGHATVTHPDGTNLIIEKNVPVFQGDVIETDSAGAVNITFNDSTVFAVSNNAKMAIDEFVYDASKDGEGQADVSVMRGVFVYTSGFVGKEDHSDVHIKTPVGSIGIRGTTLTGYIPEQGSGDTPQISLIEGAIVVQPNQGPEIFLDESRETVELNSDGTSAKNIGIVPADEFINEYNVVRSVAPALFTSVDSALSVTPATDGQNLQTPGELPTEQLQPTDSPENTDEKIPDNADPANESSVTPNASQQTASEETMPLENPPIVEMKLLGETFGENLAIPDFMGTQPLPKGPLGHNFTGNLGTLLPVLQPPPPPGTGTHDGTHFNPALHTPVAKVSNYNSLEQSGLEGELHTIDISRYFYDPDGTPLNYIITGISDPNGVIQNSFVTGGGILGFRVNTTLSADAAINIHVAATDGTLQSSSMNFQFDVYNSNLPAAPITAGNDTFGLSGPGGYRFSMAAGNDDATTLSTSPNNFIFGGLGNDVVYLNSNGNKIFGESGDDILKILSTGANNIISGGDGDDQLWLNNTGGISNQAFGGDGNDEVYLASTAMGQIQSNQILVDAGLNFDSLILTGTGSLDLSAINQGSLHGIEKIESSGAVNDIYLDILDIMQNTDLGYLFIANVNSLTVTNVNGAENLEISATGVSNPYITDGNTYDVYTNGNQTLYVETGTTVTGL